MCGIGGIATTQHVDAGALVAMSRSLRHRGPDDEGFALVDDRGIPQLYRGEQTVGELRDLPELTGAFPAGRLGFVHRRLSILDLSTAAHQPIVSKDGQMVLVYNGEIYNYVELARDLRAYGWKDEFAGDTSTLLAAVQTWGMECLQRLRGMWAFALFDRRKNQLVLSRDRYGIKPLYYTIRDGKFGFASEIKALLDARLARPLASAQKVVGLISHGIVDEDVDTLFSDVKSVPPGATLTVNLQTLSVKVERYYDLTTRNIPHFRGSAEDALEEYNQRFTESIGLHLRSDVPVGSCLSGGLDSNLIAAAVTEQLPGKTLHAFTAAYKDTRLDESEHVRAHAEMRHQIATHFVYPTADDLWEQLTRLVRAQDHPLCSSSPFAQWMVMRLAHQAGIKVLLDGQGADEVMGGYSYFVGAHLLDLIRSMRWVAAVKDAKLCASRRGISIPRELARATYQHLPLSVQRAARQHARLGSQWIDGGYQQLIAESQPQRSRVTNFRDYCLKAVRSGLPELLRYEDRSSMAFSIESRVPFLDAELVEFVLSLPSDIKLRDGWSKYIQRRASVGRMPEGIVWRRDKLGFATPQQTWKAELTPRLLDWIHSMDIPPVLDRRKIIAVAQRDIQNRTHLSEFWQLMFLLKWFEVFQVQLDD